MVEGGQCQDLTKMKMCTICNMSTGEHWENAKGHNLEITSKLSVGTLHFMCETKLANLKRKTIGKTS